MCGVKGLTTLLFRMALNNTHSSYFILAVKSGLNLKFVTTDPHDVLFNKNQFCLIGTISKTARKALQKSKMQQKTFIPT